MKKIITLTLIIYCFNLFSQKTIPNIDLVDLNHKKVNLQETLKEDRLFVLSFWATWCVPCINELDAIANVYDDWQEETNVEIIAISIDDPRGQKRIKPLVNGKDWDYKVLLDKNQDLKRAFNISVIPYILIVKGNKILYKHSGYTPGSEDELYAKILKFSKK